jgi:hypothetical protein
LAKVAVVRSALADNGYPDVPVQGVLCFTKADLPVLGTLKMRGYLLLSRKALAKRLNANGPLTPPDDRRAWSGSCGGPPICLVTPRRWKGVDRVTASGRRAVIWS